MFRRFKMSSLSKTILTGTAILQLAAFGALGATLYQLDNGNIGGAFNHSDGTEPLDNWVGNEFTALAGANLITRVDLAVNTVTPGTTAQLAIYQFGNPVVGPTRVYTQTFTPIVTPGFVTLDQINLTTPVLVDVGSQFLVSVLIRNVIGAPPNDVYPWVYDTSTSAAGSFWARSAPNTFNLDDLSQAFRLDHGLPPDGSGQPPFTVGPHHLILRAFGTVVPEPSTFALAGIGAAALVIFRRRTK
jgi:hypothetical protein